MSLPLSNHNIASEPERLCLSGIYTIFLKTKSHQKYKEAEAFGLHA
jgi:hypothetical protein